MGGQGETDRRTEIVTGKEKDINMKEREKKRTGRERRERDGNALTYFKIQQIFFKRLNEF